MQKILIKPINQKLTYRESLELFTSNIKKELNNIPENEKCIGLYSNYENSVDGAYDVMVGCEVAAGVSQPESVEMATIAAGKYAKFIVHGDVQQAVGDFWMKLWGMELDRKFGSDFEEYQPGEDMANAEIHLYISLN